jgi:hypothetical protein
MSDDLPPGITQADVDAQFSNLAYAMAIRGPCVICKKEITIHDMRGDQVIAANDGGSKQAHRYCWEKR